MSASIVRLSLDTSELRSGDIICTWGMRVLIEGEPQTYPSGRGQTVYYWQGTVTNLAEVWEEGFIPRSYLTTHKWQGGWVVDRNDVWTIQGSELAWWSVERSTA